VFDEAQRAWDAKHLANFMSQKKGQTNFQMSEPEFLISVMDRHDGWCTIICLIGGGQEINAGEAGLTEWFSALKRSFRNWKVYTSEQLAHRDYHWGQDLPAFLEGLESQSLPALHLAVSVRSFRAEKLSEFIGALVAGEAKEAKELYQAIKETYPIVLTRELSHARQWLRDRGRGDIAEIGHEALAEFLSSPGARTRPDGRTKKANSANALRTSLRTFFRYCHEAGYASSNAARLIRRALCGAAPPRALSDEEQGRLLVALAQGRGGIAERDHYAGWLYPVERFGQHCERPEFQLHDDQRGVDHRANHGLQLHQPELRGVAGARERIVTPI